tara:strand:- start:2545 stop:2724 length:180 start_codon:yes stop_codon:yes gene_type:complete
MKQGKDHAIININKLILHLFMYVFGLYFLQQQKIHGIPEMRTPTVKILSVYNTADNIIY